LHLCVYDEKKRKKFRKNSISSIISVEYLLGLINNQLQKGISTVLRPRHANRGGRPGGDVAELGVGDGGGPVVHQHGTFAAAYVHKTGGQTSAGPELWIKAPFMTDTADDLAVSSAVSAVRGIFHDEKRIRGQRFQTLIAAVGQG